MSGDAFLGKGGVSRYSHDMRLSVLPAIGLLIFPSLPTYTSNISIWRGSISMYASIFWVTLVGDSTYFRCGVKHCISGCSNDLCRLRLKFPKKNEGQPQVMNIIK